MLLPQSRVVLFVAYDGNDVVLVGGSLGAQPFTSIAAAQALVHQERALTATTMTLQPLDESTAALHIALDERRHPSDDDRAGIIALYGAGVGPGEGEGEIGGEGEGEGDTSPAVEGESDDDDDDDAPSCVHGRWCMALGPRRED